MKKSQSKTVPAPKSTNPFNDLELINLADYAKVIRERWMLALAVSVTVAALAGYYLLSRAPVYEASSALLIEPSKERVLDIDEVVDTSLQGRPDTLLHTHVEQLLSSSFRERVAEMFDESDRNAILAPFLEKADPDDPPPSLARILEDRVAVSRMGSDTYLLQIDVRHGDPEIAAMIANKYADEYIQYLLERSSASNNQAIIFLNRQADEIRAEVEEMERDLQDYREEHNLVSLAENQNNVVERVSQLSRAHTEARIRRVELETVYDDIERYRDNAGDLLEIEEIVGFGTITDLLHEREEIESKRSVLSEEFLERHPRMIENERSLEQVELRLERNIDRAVAEFRNRLENAREQEKRLMENLAQAEAESLRMDRIAGEHNVLRRNLDSTRRTYDQILERLNETSIASQLENTNIRVADSATVPLYPVEPNRKRTVLMVLFLGGILFVGVPIGIDAVDSRIKSWSDVESFIDHCLIGEIPLFRKVPEKDRASVVANEKDENAAEAFRAAYSQMELSSRVELPKALMVTSTLPEEGKSLVASNLALAFAGHGKKTLLIDCDLRRPTQHRLFNLKNEHGLLTWLEAGVELAGNPLEDTRLDIVKAGENLDLLRAGGRSKKPTEYFDDDTFAGLIQSLRKHYDLLILDTSPAGIFPDGLSLSKHVDEILYVCWFNKIPRQQARKVLERLDQTDAEIVGMILNGMPDQKRGAYYYHGYGYYGQSKYKKYYDDDKVA